MKNGNWKDWGNTIRHLCKCQTPQLDICVNVAITYTWITKLEITLFKLKQGSQHQIWTTFETWRMIISLKPSKNISEKKIAKKQQIPSSINHESLPTYIKHPQLKKKTNVIMSILREHKQIVPLFQTLNTKNKSNKW